VSDARVLPKWQYLWIAGLGNVNGGDVSRTYPEFWVMISLPKISPSANVGSFCCPASYLVLCHWDQPYAKYIQLPPGTPLGTCIFKMKMQVLRGEGSFGPLSKKAATPPHSFTPQLHPLRLHQTAQDAQNPEGQGVCPRLHPETAPRVCIHGVCYGGNCHAGCHAGACLMSRPAGHVCAPAA